MSVQRKKDCVPLFKFHKKFCKNKLKSLIEELHNAYIIKNTYYSIIVSNSHLIDSSVYSINNLHKLVNNELLSNTSVRVPVKIIKIDDEDLNENLKAMAGYLNYTIFTKIPKLNHLIDLYSSLIEIPYSEIIKIYNIFNTEVASFLLNGNVLSLPKGIGRFGIEFRKRPPSKFAINWKESNIYKRYLISNGIAVRTWGNPDGEPWLIAFDDTHYIRWTWKKKGVKVPNATYYAFKVTNTTSYENIPVLEERYRTKEEVIKSTLMGNLQKSLMLSRKFTDIKESYHNGI